MCYLAFQDIPTVTVSDAECQLYQQKWKKQQQNNKTEEQKSKAISIGTADLLEYYQSEDRNNNDDNNAQVDYTLCLGADTFLDLTSGKWRRTQDILDLIQGRFLVLYRATEATTTYDQEPLQRSNSLNNSSASTSASASSEPDPHQNERLMEQISKLNANYGDHAAQLLHVPTLGAVSSTLVRSLSSSLSLASRTNGGNDLRNNKSKNDNAEHGNSSYALSLEEQQVQQVVAPQVLEYMQQHQLYGFATTMSLNTEENGMAKASNNYSGTSAAPVEEDEPSEGLSF
jgi:nicotinic acid mononucleotide adenylyltransferase